MCAPPPPIFDLVLDRVSGWPLTPGILLSLPCECWDHRHMPSHSSLYGAWAPIHPTLFLSCWEFLHTITGLPNTHHRLFLLPHAAGFGEGRGCQRSCGKADSQEHSLVGSANSPSQKLRPDYLFCSFSLAGMRVLSLFP